MILTALAASLLVLPVSCSKQDRAESASGHEMTFSVSAESLTKGVVTGSTLTDNVTGFRPLFISAFLHSQIGTHVPYFTGERFVRNGTAWKHTPSIYWPMGGTMDMLFYSAVNEFGTGMVRWGTSNNAERMRLYFGSDRTQDDVLFGSLWGTASSGSSPLNVSLEHSQAWIVFQFSLKAGALDLPVTLTRVVLTDTYITGILNVENAYGHPTHEWDFRSSEARDRVVEDPDGVYGTPVTSVVKSVRMLIPEQERKKVVVYYTVDGVEYSAERELSHSYWNAGKKYTYTLVFDPVTRSAGDEFQARIVELDEVEF